jgi:hypothetical protein
MALFEVCVRRRLDRGATTKTRGPAASLALELAFGTRAGTALRCP